MSDISDTSRTYTRPIHDPGRPGPWSSSSCMAMRRCLLRVHHGAHRRRSGSLFWETNGPLPKLFLWYIMYTIYLDPVFCGHFAYDNVFGHAAYMRKIRFLRLNLATFRVPVLNPRWQSIQLNGAMSHGQSANVIRPVPMMLVSQWVPRDVPRDFPRYFSNDVGFLCKTAVFRGYPWYTPQHSTICFLPGAALPNLESMRDSDFVAPVVHSC